MRRPRDLPAVLGEVFAISDAAALGISAERMRRRDLTRPFRGIRAQAGVGRDVLGDLDDFAAQAMERTARAHAYAPRLRDRQFFSHETAAALWGAPLPLVRDAEGNAVASELPVHISVFGTMPLPRIEGVVGHRARIETSTTRVIDGLDVSSPATTWASLGGLPLYDLVAVGDHLCRVWREGIGRPNAGARSIATREELAASIEAGRRVGIRRLRSALELVREDSWSPRETRVRCILHDHGLPEPALNLDVFDDDGRFLACIDLAFPAQKVAVEYHGLIHSARYAKDVERMARLRAAGWIVIEATAALLSDEHALVARVRAALRSR